MLTLTDEEKQYLFCYLYRDEPDRERHLISIIDRLQSAIIEQDKRYGKLNLMHTELKSQYSELRTGYKRLKAKYAEQKDQNKKLKAKYAEQKDQNKKLKARIQKYRSLKNPILLIKYLLRKIFK